MTHKELKSELKQHLKLSVEDRYDGATYQDGMKISLLFDDETICSLFVWKKENAGLYSIEEVYCLDRR